MTQEKPTKEGLRDMRNKGMTLYQISRKYNTTILEIFQLEKEYGMLSLNTSLKTYYNISKEDLESMYIDEGMTQQQIAEEIGCSRSSVYSMMNCYHIQSRVRNGKYTPQERALKIDEIVQRYSNGETQEEIAEKVGYTPRNVGVILQECGVQIRKGGKYTDQQRASKIREIIQMYKSGETQEEIAEKVGYHRRYIGTILREHDISTRLGGKYTPKQRALIDDEIEQMYINGYTQEQIAKKFGYDRANVSIILSERGVPTRGSNGLITTQKMSSITDDKLQECIDKGMNQHQIAEHFGVCDATIFNMAEEFSIHGMVDGYRCTTPEYQSWKYAVLDKCHRTCQLCGKTGVRLEVHHIIPWADAPELRYNVDNGVPLCHECHKNIKGHEYEYAQQFLDITQPQCREHEIIESMPWEPPLELHSIIDYPEEKGGIII